MDDINRRPIADPAAFVRGGNAILTIVSKATGVRFTYRVIRRDKLYFVSVLTGSNNESDYTYLGTIFPDGTYRHGRKSSIGWSAPSAVAFGWFFAHLVDPKLAEKLEVWHEGRCCRCGRTLTVPSSVESGIGPECARITNRKEHHESTTTSARRDRASA